MAAPRRLGANRLPARHPFLRSRSPCATVARELWPEIVAVAAKNTVVYTAIAFAGGLALAFGLAPMKLSPVAPYRWIASIQADLRGGSPGDPDRHPAADQRPGVPLQGALTGVF